jgi:hypothetical protein
MIDVKEIEKCIKESCLDGASVNLYLFENKKTKQDALSLYELNINPEIVEQIRTLSKDYLLSLVEQAKSLDEIPTYNPDGDQEIFKIDSSQVGLFDELYEYVAGRQPRLPYNKDVVKDDKLKAWIFRFEAVVDKKIKQILFFQRFQPGKMLGSKGVTIFEHGKKFELLGKNVLNFNLVMDLVFYQDTFIVTRASSFEYIFGYEEYYRENAASLVLELKQKQIKGLDYTLQFLDIDLVNKQISTSTRLARKLCSARVNGYYRKINYKKLTALNDRHDLHLHLNDKKREWIIDEELDFQIMARILNDDYEISQLTENEYISLGKQIF